MLLWVGITTTEGLPEKQLSPKGGEGENHADALSETESAVTGQRVPSSWPRTKVGPEGGGEQGR